MAGLLIFVGIGIIMLTILNHRNRQQPPQRWRKKDDDDCGCDQK